MKKLSFLVVFALLAIISCGKPKNSNISVNQANLQNSDHTQSNSKPNLSTNILQNTNPTSQTNSQVNADILKQIEAQQLETADPRQTANKGGNTNSNQTLKKTPASPER